MKLKSENNSGLNAPLLHECGTLLTELSSQLGTGHIASLRLISFFFFQEALVFYLIAMIKMSSYLSLQFKLIYDLLCIHLHFHPLRVVTNL